MLIFSVLKAGKTKLSVHTDFVSEQGLSCRGAIFFYPFLRPFFSRVKGRTLIYYLATKGRTLIKGH